RVDLGDLRSVSLDAAVIGGAEDFARERAETDHGSSLMLVRTARSGAGRRVFRCRRDHRAATKAGKPLGAPSPQTSQRSGRRVPRQIRGGTMVVNVDAGGRNARKMPELQSIHAVERGA